MKMSISDAIVAAVLGYCVVFIGLILLTAVVILMGKAMAGVLEQSGTPAPFAPPAPYAPPAPSAPPAPYAPPAPPAAPAPSAAPAPGSAGVVKLFDVSDREAAMLMAITANKIGKPLNELRFKSIKEVK